MFRRLMAAAVLGTLFILFNVSWVWSQGGNLLNDPSFEYVGDYKVVQTADDAVFAVPPAWNGWVTLTPRSQEWQNLIPNGFPHTGLFKFDQNRSLSISRGFATFTTAVFQTVTVPENANVIGSARGFMERGNPPVDGGRFRVGIDPSGGGNPQSGGIVWSPWVTTEDGWAQATVEATAAGTSVTLLLYATQSQPSDPNSMYWDDASLTVGGGGGGPGDGGDPAVTNTPVIPTPAFADFVVPQAPQPDGSIVHIVQPGDTLAAIAVAYGLLPDDILALNPDMGSGRFIFAGQSILIQEANGSADEGGDEDDAGATEEPTASASPTEAAGNDTDNEDAEATDAPTQVAAVSTDTPAPTSTVTTATVEPTAPADDDAGTDETDDITATATPSPEPVAPTSTPVPTDAPPAPVTEVAQRPTNTTAICVWMFNDANQNRIQEEAEGLLAGGSIVINMGDAVAQTYVTDGNAEPFCFEEVDAGSYTVSAAPPDSYGLTTAQQLSVRVQAGVRVDARFGAAEGVTAVAANTLPDDDVTQDTGGQAVVVDESAPDTASLLQISGLIVFGLAAVVLLGGVGLAIVLRTR